MITYTMETKDLPTVLEWWEYMVNIKPEKFSNYNNLIGEMIWDSQEMDKLVALCIEYKFRLGKMDKRVKKYILEDEVERFRLRVFSKDSASIRFGNFKDAKASDFCLIGGCYYKPGKKFYLYYRAVELTLEFIFDLILLQQTFNSMGLVVKKLFVITPRAFTSSRAGRLKFFRKLKAIMRSGGLYVSK